MVKYPRKSLQEQAAHVIFTELIGRNTWLDRKFCDLDDQNNMLALAIYKMFQGHPEIFPAVSPPVVIPVFLVATTQTSEELVEEDCAI